MKVLLTSLVFLLASFSNAQFSVDDGVSCPPTQTQPMQTMSMDDEHTQCESVCIFCMAIQNTAPNLKYLTVVSAAHTFVGTHYYFLSEPILNPPPIA